MWQEKNKGKKSRALMRTLIITKSGDAQEMDKDIKYKD